MGRIEIDRIETSRIETDRIQIDRFEYNLIESNRNQSHRKRSKLDSNDTRSHRTRLETIEARFEKIEARFDPKRRMSRWPDCVMLALMGAIESTQKIGTRVRRRHRRRRRGASFAVGRGRLHCLLEESRVVFATVTEDAEALARVNRGILKAIAVSRQQLFRLLRKQS